MKAHVMMTGLMLAWLVSPESLAILGKGIAASGMQIIIPLAGSMIFAVFCAVLIHHVGPGQKGHAGEHAILSLTYGKTVAAAMALAGRIPVLLFASIAMLVSAGFAFNEIFLYWFPNFLFASLLLLTICILHLFQEKVALWGQVVFAGIVVLGLIFLMIMGIVGNGDSAPEVARSPLSLPFFVFGLTFLLFLGFDFYQPAAQVKRTIYIAPTLTFLLLTGWVLVALEHVPTARLAASSLPHIVIARAIGGGTGHYIIGIIIIIGALSGVNGFLLAVRNTVADLVENRYFPEILKKGWSVAIPAGAVIGTMMMTGFAGDEMIEVQLRASLFLWLMLVGFRCLAAGVSMHRFSAYGKLYGGTLAGVIFMLNCLLIGTDTHVVYIIGFQSFFIIVFVLISLIWARTHGEFSRNK